MAGAEAQGRSREAIESIPAADRRATPGSALDPAVRCAGLVVQYSDVTAVNGLDLEVRRGECFGLLGPNGAGKTTTVEVIEGLRAPSAGVVEVLGQRWGTGQDRQLRRRLGVALQETRLTENLTVVEIVRLFRSFYPTGRSVDEVIALLGLVEKQKTWAGKLSGGQRQRLALACALVGAPDLLLLDEPTTGLDPQARLQIWAVVEQFLEGGGTVLLTTHYMDEAARLCQRLGILDRGRLIALDTPAALIELLGAEEVITLKLSAPLPEAALLRVPAVHRVEQEPEALETKLVLHVQDVASALPPVLALASAEGVQLRTLTTHRATLDDVFVHLTGRALRDG